MKQTSIFEFLYEKKKITKPIRLIEFFAGIGAQYKALKQVFDNVESYKICEWAYNSIVSYNYIHNQDFTDYSKGKTRERMLERIKGISTNYNEPLSDKQLAKKSDEWIRSAYNNVVATHNLVNIMDVHGEDLEIVDTDKYEYILTYSFPCQDLSLAGNKKGMSVSQAQGGTRSGLLWEVERILDELENKPQILLMENVPEVIGKNNIADFQKWEMKLEQLGYQNYIEIINAKDHGIPQNRKRCFMVSVLGDYYYEFPRKHKLKLRLKDMLEEQVDEKYYLSKKMIDFYTYNTEKQKEKGNGFTFKPQTGEEIGRTVTTRAGSRMDNNFIEIKNNNSKGYETATIGDGIDISTRMQYHRGTVQKGTAQTITCKGGENVGVVVKQAPKLKETLCNDLIESGAVKENDIVKHSYTKQIMSGKKKSVEKQDEMITLTTRGDCLGVVVKDQEFKRYENYITWKNKQGEFNTECNRAMLENDLSLTIPTGNTPKVAEGEHLRIRKLTPLETMRLMGFEDQDYNAMRKAQMSDMAIYHMAGDSIVVNVLVDIFKEMK